MVRPSETETSSQQLSSSALDGPVKYIQGVWRKVYSRVPNKHAARLFNFD